MNHAKPVAHSFSMKKENYKNLYCSSLEASMQSNLLYRVTSTHSTYFFRFPFMLCEWFAAEASLTVYRGTAIQKLPAHKKIFVREVILVLSIILSALICAHKFKSKGCRF